MDSYKQLLELINQYIDNYENRIENLKNIVEDVNESCLNEHKIKIEESYERKIILC